MTLINALSDNDRELVNWLPGSVPSWYNVYEYDANKLFHVGKPTSGSIISVHHNGNFGIGTTTPDLKLSVNGNIRARKIKVENTAWPDYVFDEKYDFASALSHRKPY